MKILIVNSYYYFDTNGGAEFCARKLAESLAASGHDTYVLAPSDKNKRMKINGVKVTYLRNALRVCEGSASLMKKLIVKAARFFDIFDFPKYYREMKKGYDIVSTHAIEELSPSIWLAAKLTHTPVVHTMHDKYVMCYRLFMLKNGAKCKNPGIICRLWRKLMDKMIKIPAAFVSPSAYMAREINKVDACVIPNSLEMTKELPIHKKGETFKFAFVGGFNEHKGIDLLLDSFESLDIDAELHIAGKKPSDEATERRVAANKNIHVYGWLSGEEVDELLRSCDALLCPSIWEENFPYAVLNAYNAGIPVIGTSLGGVPEMVIDGKTGIIIDPFKKGDLSAAMKKINDDEFYNELCINVIKVRDEFSQTLHVKRYVELFEKCIKK